MACLFAADRILGQIQPVALRFQLLLLGLPAWQVILDLLVAVKLAQCLFGLLQLLIQRFFVRFLPFEITRHLLLGGQPFDFAAQLAFMLLQGGAIMGMEGIRRLQPFKVNRDTGQAQLIAVEAIGQLFDAGGKGGLIIDLHFALFATGQRQQRRVQSARYAHHIM